MQIDVLYSSVGHDVKKKYRMSDYFLRIRRGGSKGEPNCGSPQGLGASRRWIRLGAKTHLGA